jgi:hypothetical protein
MTPTLHASGLKFIQRRQEAKDTAGPIAHVDCTSPSQGRPKYSLLSPILKPYHPMLTYTHFQCPTTTPHHKCVNTTTLNPHLLPRGQEEGTHGCCQADAHCADIWADVTHGVKHSHTCAHRQCGRHQSWLKALHKSKAAVDPSQQHNLCKLFAGQEYVSQGWCAVFTKSNTVKTAINMGTLAQLQSLLLPAAAEVCVPHLL